MGRRGRDSPGLPAGKAEVDHEGVEVPVEAVEAGEDAATPGDLPGEEVAPPRAEDLDPAPFQAPPRIPGEEPVLVPLELPEAERPLL